MPQPKSPPLLWICAILIAITFVAFWNVQQNDFVNYDDPDYVTENATVKKGLTGEGIAWAFRSNHASNWHPLTWISHMIDWQIYGGNATGHHRTSLIFHAANAALLFLVLRKMTGAVWRSAFVAAAFALHPLRVESVAWVAERKDVLSTLFWLLTLLAYARYVESGKQPVRTGKSVAAGVVKYDSRYFAFALVFFALGLMSKPMLVTLPFVLLLLDVWPLRRVGDVPWLTEGSPAHAPRTFRQLIIEKVPFFALTIVFCFVTVWAQKTGGSVRSLTEFPLVLRMENAVVSYVRYIGKMFWPDDLAVFYPHPESWATWQVFAAAAIVCGLTFAAFKWIKRFPYFSIGWFWFIGTAVPVIGIVQVGIQSMADRYTYVPMIGLYLAIAWGVHTVVNKLNSKTEPATEASVSRKDQQMVAAKTGLSTPQIVASAVAVAALVGCFVVTHSQVRVWRNSEVLFRSALKVTTSNYTAHENLGIVLAAQSKEAKAAGDEATALKKLEEARAHFETGLKLYPTIAESHHNLGNALVGLGQLDQARTHYLDAIRINPNYDSAYMNLGLIAGRNGRMDEARGFYSKVVELNPNDFVGHYNLATAFLELGNVNGATSHYSKALEIEPSHIPSMFQLGIVAARQGRRDEAASQFTRVLSLQPEHGGALEQLAQLR